ncbi:MAG TPA: hypothetical protein VEC76_09765 [Streptosporangiaceae bacterium]|nr:hypothetical protein [Streptosporangiaceae bacterium]
MGVQLASALDPAAEAAQLAQWAKSYRDSAVPGGLLTPRAAAGEQWVAVIHGVGRDEVSQQDLADPGILLGHGARDTGHQAWLSRERVVFAAGRRVVAEWRLDGLFELRTLDDLTGIVTLAFEPNPDYDDRFPALLSDKVRWSARAVGPVPPGYNRRRVEVDWLKFEAVFADGRDRLGGWTKDLPARLSRIVRKAQNDEARLVRRATWAAA